MGVIREHYRLLSRRFAFLRFPQDSMIGLAYVDDAIQVCLSKPIKFEHEGELTINLFRRDIRLYSLVFTLGLRGSQRIAYAGALQGASGPDSLAIYRSLTHNMHGLRPRDLLVTAFRMFCRSLGIVRILAVSDDRRVCSSDYFESSAQVFSSYDSAWIDCGAVAADEGFFELPPTLSHRPPESIPTRKRAQYRRRYALLDAMSLKIDESVRRARSSQTPLTLNGAGR